MGVALAFQLIPHVGLIGAQVDPLSLGGPKRVWAGRAFFMPLPAGRGAFVEHEAAEQEGQWLDERLHRDLCVGSPAIPPGFWNAPRPQFTAGTMYNTSLGGVTAPPFRAKAQAR